MAAGLRIAGPLPGTIAYMPRPHEHPRLSPGPRASLARGRDHHAGCWEGRPGKYARPRPHRFAQQHAPPPERPQRVEGVDPVPVLAVQRLRRQVVVVDVHPHTRLAPSRRQKLQGSEAEVSAARAPRAQGRPCFRPGVRDTLQRCLPRCSAARCWRPLSAGARRAPRCWTRRSAAACWSGRVAEAGPPPPSCTPCCRRPARRIPRPPPPETQTCGGGPIAPPAAAPVPAWGFTGWLLSWSPSWRPQARSRRRQNGHPGQAAWGLSEG